MTRKAHLEPHLSNDELKSRYLLSKDPVEARRYHLLWLVSENWSIKQAAEIISYNYDYAKEIVKKYNAEGEKSLANGRKKAKKCRYSQQMPRRKHRKGDPIKQAVFKYNLTQKVRELHKESPNAEIQVWAFDEHRLGLKPMIRRIWSPIGQKPIAVIEHRYQWLYLYGFVHPKTGETEWFIIPRVNVDWFNEVLKAIALATGAGKEKR